MLKSTKNKNPYLSFIIISLSKWILCLSNYPNCPLWSSISINDFLICAYHSFSIAAAADCTSASLPRRSILVLYSIGLESLLIELLSSCSCYLFIFFIGSKWLRIWLIILELVLNFCFIIVTSWMWISLGLILFILKKGGMWCFVLERLVSV